MGSSKQSVVGGSGTTSNSGRGVGAAAAVGTWTSGTTSSNRAVRRRAAVAKSKGLNELIENDLNEQQNGSATTPLDSAKGVDLEFESFKQSMRSVNRGKRRSNEGNKNELAEVFAKMKAQKEADPSPTPSLPSTISESALLTTSNASETDGSLTQATSSLNKKDQMVAMKRLSRSTGSLPTGSPAEEVTPKTELSSMIPTQTSITSAKEAMVSTEDGEYEKLLQLAQTKDFSKLESLRMIYRAGVDKEGRPVVVLMMKNFVKQIETEFLLLYFIFVMDKVVENDYVLVFCNTKSSGDNRPSFSWMRKAYSLFKRK